MIYKNLNVFSNASANNLKALAQLPSIELAKMPKAKKIAIADILEDSQATRDGLFSPKPSNKSAANAASKADVAANKAAFATLAPNTAATANKTKAADTAEILADSAVVRDGFNAGPTLSLRLSKFFGKISGAIGSAIGSIVASFKNTFAKAKKVFVSERMAAAVTNKAASKAAANAKQVPVVEAETVATPKEDVKVTVTEVASNTEPSNG